MPTSARRISEYDPSISYPDTHPGVVWQGQVLKVKQGQVAAANETPGNPAGRDKWIPDPARVVQSSLTSVLGATATDVAAIDGQISSAGEVISDISTVTDGPGGSGVALVSSFEMPIGSGNYYRRVERLSDSLTFINYWDGSTWLTDWRSSTPSTAIQVISSADNGTTLPPGFYDIDADAAFSFTLEAPAEHYRFANSRLNLSATNTVTINAANPATETFTDVTGAQVAGPLTLDVPGYGFELYPESTTDWHIVDAVIIPPSTGDSITLGGPQVALADGATVNWDAAVTRNARLTSNVSNALLADPTNLEAGRYYAIGITSTFVVGTTVQLGPAFLDVDGTAMEDFFIPSGGQRNLTFYSPNGTVLVPASGYREETNLGPVHDLGNQTPTSWQAVHRNVAMTSSFAAVAFSNPGNIQAGQLYAAKLGSSNAAGTVYTFGTAFLNADRTQLEPATIASGEIVDYLWMALDSSTLVTIAPVIAQTVAANGIDDTLAQAQALTADRDVDLAGNDLTFSGSGPVPVEARDDGTVAAVGLRPNSVGNAYTQGVPVVFDISQGHAQSLAVDNTTFNDVLIGTPSNLVNGGSLNVGLFNTGGASRTFTFGTAWTTTQGAQLPNITLAAGESLHLLFAMSGVRAALAGSLDVAAPAANTFTFDFTAADWTLNTIATLSNLGGTIGSTINSQNTERFQSFSATGSGDVTQVILRLGNVGGGTQTARVRVYDGAGTGGTVLAEATVTVTGSTFADYTAVFPTPAAVVNGSTYTVGVVRTGASTSTLSWGTTGSPDAFPGFTVSNGLLGAVDGMMEVAITPTGLSGGTLTIPATTHGLGAGRKHVTIYDVADDIVIVSPNVNPATGDVVLDSATAFDGSAYIS